MFSIEDVLVYTTSMQSNALAANVQPIDTYGINVSSQGVFAIKFLSNDTSINVSDCNIISDEYLKKLEELNNKLPDNETISSKATQIEFLKTLKKHNLSTKIGLFRETDNVGSTNSGEWSEVKLNESGTDIIEIPCN